MDDFIESEAKGAWSVSSLVQYLAFYFFLTFLYLEMGNADTHRKLQTAFFD